MARPVGVKIARKNIYAKQFAYILDYLEDAQNITERTLLNYKRAFTLLYFGGFRASELVTLNNSDIVDVIEEGVLHLANKTKTKTSREVYFSKKGRKAIKKLFKKAVKKEGLDTVAIRPWGKELERFNPQALTRSLNSILSKSIGKQYTTHSFRAGYITQMAKEGINLKTIQENIGHSKAVTTLGYIQVDEKDKKSAVNKIR